jgi:hypothetical protein
MMESVNLNQINKYQLFNQSIIGNGKHKQILHNLTGYAKPG